MQWAEEKKHSIPQMVVIAMAYVFELTVRVDDLLEPSNVNIELTRVIDRPQEEYVGEERIVHVLFAHGRFHSILKLADAKG